MCLNKEKKRITIIVALSLPCCNKQMGDRKRYREYHRSGDAKIPRTTAWRFKKKQKQSFDGATTAAAEDSGMLNHIG